jgi:hypothetical protein
MEVVLVTEIADEGPIVCYKYALAVATMNTRIFVSRLIATHQTIIYVKSSI